ncbi:MAG: hypothetical protein ACXV8Q_11080 [Methylobacter sp.]
MTQTLQRITTEYIDFEDRIRLSGELDNAEPVVIWLTQRLLHRLLVALLRWLGRQDTDAPSAEILQSFAQQAARAELAVQVPVSAGESSAVWLALSVDIAQSEQSISLTFRGAEGQDATLTMETKPLRQWLSILHEAYINAEWELDVWPGWLRESAKETQRQGVLH